MQPTDDVMSESVRQLVHTPVHPLVGRVAERLHLQRRRDQYYPYTRADFMRMSSP